jgi:hypothetical protein
LLEISLSPKEGEEEGEEGEGEGEWEVLGECRCRMMREQVMYVYIYICIQTAFLTACVKERICVKQPPGFIEKGKEGYVLELLKSLSE